MRARNLKPGFFKNEQLAGVPFEARLLFAGLWCLADRAGRLEDRPLRIKAELFPYDACLVQDLCSKLEEKGLIYRYEKNSIHYIQVTNFSKHQSPHVKEAESTIPAPDKHQTRTRQTPVEHPLNPSSLTPSSLNPESLSPPPPGGFELVWSKYPRREGRKEAERHFKASVKTIHDFSDMQKALDSYLHHIYFSKIEPRFIKMGSTWFNNWRDWIDYQEVTNGSNDRKSPPDLMANFRAARESVRLREEAARRAVSTGGGDLPDVPSTAEGDDGG